MHGWHKDENGTDRWYWNGRRVPSVEIADMLWPALCRHCNYLHDAGRIETAQRYSDCSVWRCPNCAVLIDDRPHSWGGSLTGEEAVLTRAGGFDPRTGMWWM